MSNPQIVLYGHFGTGNIGNDSTLEAMLYNIGRYLPDASVTCICTGPQEVAQRYGIKVLPVDISEDRNIRNTNFRPEAQFPRLVKRMTDEIQFWLSKPNWFRSIDQFYIVGTGSLDDMAVVHPWSAPYDLFKWCRAAKLGGTQLIFISVGAGPIVNPVSKALMLNALKAADYRSYRDEPSMKYVSGVGFDTRNDKIYPDLVYSLPESMLACPPPNPDEPNIIGLGVISYYGWKHDDRAGEPTYQKYITKVKEFVRWLLDHGFVIRLLYGDTTDQRPVDEVIELVKSIKQVEWPKSLIVEPITDLQDLFEQISQTDVVVASRFHNVLCALMLGRPVISLGYHDKNVALMEEMGLIEYCQHIESIDINTLATQFQSLINKSSQISTSIIQKREQYRHLLDEQYSKLFNITSIRT